MPLYDVLLMTKWGVQRADVAQLVKDVAVRVLSQQGVVAGVKSYGKVPLAYDIKKRDGWHKEAMLMQLTVMAPSTLRSELEYLNKEDRLLRWMVLHHRGTQWMKTKSSRNER